LMAGFLPGPTGLNVHNLVEEEFHQEHEFV